MIETRIRELTRCPRPVWMLAVAVGLGGILAGCASSDSDVAQTLVTGGNQAEGITADYFKRPEFCPRVEIRPGTGRFVDYERGHEFESSFIRYQAIMNKTARECASTADGLSIKVGIAGRVVSGPKGGPGSVTLPIRAVVAMGNGDVLYSELFKVPVTIEPTELNRSFSKVIQQIAVPLEPSERNVIIYVGFDEGSTG